MTRMRVFIRIALSIVWVACGALKVAAADDRHSVQAVYNACLGTKDNVQAFCFGYLSAAAQTWAQAGTRYGDADLTSMCREGRTIEPPDLAARFIEHVEAHPEVKTQLAISVVFDLVCNEQK